MTDRGEFDERVAAYLRRRAASPTPRGMVERLLHEHEVARLAVRRRWTRPTVAGLVVGAVLAAALSLAIGVGRHDDRPQSPAAVPLTPGTPGARWGGSIAYDPVTRTVVMFGGINTAGGPLTDTWVWNGRTWAQAHPAVHPPAWTSGPMAPDPTGGGVLLFGGPTTWRWDGRTWTPLRPAHAPEGDAVAAATDATLGGVLVLTSTTGPHFEACSYGTWEWKDGDWHRLTPAQSLPTGGVVLATDARSGGAVAVVGSRPALAPVGFLQTDCPAGSRAAQAYPSPTTWVWSGTTWVEQTSAETPSALETIIGPSQPPEMEVAALVPGPSGLVLFDPLWRPYAWSGSSWTRGTVPSVHPPSAGESSGASVATDTSTGETILFGGYVGSAGSTTVLPPSYQTWTWDGTRWTDRTADQPPPPTASPTPGAH